MSGRAAAVIHDDHAVSSSSDEEEHYDASPMQRSQGQRTPAAARGVSYSSVVGGSGGGAIGDDVTQRERKLTQLLSRASETIKKERSRIASLEMENDSLRQQLSQAVRGAASSSASEAQTPAVVLRTKLMDLALENFVAVEEIARLRRRVEELEEAAAASAAASSQPSSRPASRPRRCHSEHKPVQRYSDASHERRQHDHLHQPSPVPAAEAPRATSPPRSQRLPPPNHSFDAIKSTKLAHPPPSPPRERTPVKTHSTAASSVNPGATVVYAASAPPPSVTNAKGVAASSATAAPVPYNDMMLQRLRRAVAPPPTKEQLGEVVHAMVKEMSKFLKSHGTVLDLKRVDHCVYQVRDRKLNLTVDSGRLVVKCGGGHVDLLEYLERNRICTRAEQ